MSQVSLVEKYRTKVLEQVDVNGIRWYRFTGETDPANYLASVTNILSVAQHRKLKAWKNGVGEKVQEEVSDTAADFGTYIHNLLEKDLRGEEIAETDLQYEGKSLVDFLARWRKLRKDNEITVDKIELAVYSEMGYAGTLDLIGNFKGKPSVMDFKSGRYSIKSGWQLAAYKNAYDEMSGLHNGLGMVGLSVQWNKPMNAFVYQHLDFCWNAFAACFTVWKAMYYNELAKMKWRYLNEPEKAKALVDKVGVPVQRS